MRSLGLQSSLNCPFAWEYAKPAFDSPVLKCAFCLWECLTGIFQDPRITPWENWGLWHFLHVICTAPVVASSTGNTMK